jgi:CRP/FNR family transcriptional regulator
VTNPLPPCIAQIGDPAACEMCTGRNPFCGSLHCHSRSLARDQHAFLQKDRATHVHWVRGGLLRLYQTLANGKRQIVGFAFPGEFVDLAAEGEYRFGAQAVVETELRTMPRAEFKATARKHPQFSFQLFVAVSGMLNRSSELALTVGQRSAEASLAVFLLEMHRRITAGDPGRREIFLPMPRTDIADYLGLTPETISRLFTRFADREIISVHKRRGISLSALGSLQRLAEGFSSDSSDDQRHR